MPAASDPKLVLPHLLARLSSPFLRGGNLSTPGVARTRRPAKPIITPPSRTAAFTSPPLLGGSPRLFSLFCSITAIPIKAAAASPAAGSTLGSRRHRQRHSATAPPCRSPAVPRHALHSATSHPSILCCLRLPHVAAAVRHTPFIRRDHRVSDSTMFGRRVQAAASASARSGPAARSAVEPVFAQVRCISWCICTRPASIGSQAPGGER